jgi:hypothetical protein
MQKTLKIEKLNKCINLKSVHSIGLCCKKCTAYKPQTTQEDAQHTCHSIKKNAGHISPNIGTR